MELPPPRSGSQSIKPPRRLQETQIIENLLYFTWMIHRNLDGMALGFSQRENLGEFVFQGKSEKYLDAIWDTIWQTSVEVAWKSVDVA